MPQRHRDTEKNEEGKEKREKRKEQHRVHREKLEGTEKTGLRSCDVSVSRLRRSMGLFTTYPVLAHGANLCRAYGA
jgi:predicted transcriptional regulator of viral defense system